MRLGSNNRNRYPAGMDMNDYFLENQMQHQYGAGKELNGDAAFDSRVHAEDTELKESAPAAPLENPVDAEHFVGGLSY